MNIVSIQVGRPRTMTWRGELVTTSIFKSPVSGRVRVGRFNLEGDEQSDLTVHGGADKSVYAYPSEHYAFWREELPGLDLPWGAFGENLTTAGLLEDVVHIGDRLRIGTADFIVTQPRMPCYKLGIRLGREDIIKRFLESERSGFYLRVTCEGEVGAGDAVAVTPTEHDRVAVRQVVSLHTTERTNKSLLRRASELPALPAEWRENFRERLGRGGRA